MSSFWEIRVFDGLDCLIEKTIPVHRLSQTHAISLASCLLARFLDEDDIVRGFLNDRKGGPEKSLVFEETKISLNSGEVSIGHNPYAVIRRIESE